MNTFQPYRTFLKENRDSLFEFSTLDELLLIDPLPFHSSNEGFSHFAVDGTTLFAVYNDRIQIAGYIDNNKEILKLPLTSTGIRFYPLSFHSCR